MKILVADDDAVSRTLLKRTLQRSGFEVICMTDGTDALKCLLEPDGPRIAILDWMMPGADGPTVCRKVRECPDMPYVYILLLTSREAVEDVVEGFEAGADDYLIKPCRPDELKVRLRVGQRTLELQDELIHEARHDSLTRLPNRAFFVKRLDRCVQLAQQSPGYHFTLLFIDVDRFKTINDSHGHLVGDELMRAVAQRLLLAVRADFDSGFEPIGRRGLAQTADVVARIGGDEFVILLDDFADIEVGVTVAKRILKVLEVPFKIDGRELCVTASMGVACNGGAPTTATDMLRGADTAMYRAKTLGRARFEVDTPIDHSAASQRIRLEGDLRRAIAHHELHVHYQPIVRLSDCIITGFEALARWNHPILGNVPPNIFIAIAEESGSILSLGAWIMEEACRQTTEWNNAFHHSGLNVSVNVAPAQYCQDDLVAKVRSVLQRTGLHAANLTVEVTENLTMQNVDQASITLRQIQRIGALISLDDFGTGYSSLGYLLRFPIDTLKIDRSFVAGIEHNAERAAIVQTIISLGHNLGMKVVAEGIENIAQFELLSAWQCDFGQGFFFSPGVSAAKATSMLQEQNMNGAAPSSQFPQIVERTVPEFLN